MQRYMWTFSVGHIIILTYTNIGITLTGVQSGVPILIGGSVTITCTTDSPADSIMLLQDDQPLHETNNQTALTYNISVVFDSIYKNTFKCEAKLTARTDPADTAFDMIIISIQGKSIIVFWILYDTTPQFPNNLSPLASDYPALQLLKLESRTVEYVLCLSCLD